MDARRKWSLSEDALLMEGYRIQAQNPTGKGGTVNWHEVAKRLQGRDNKDPRKRYYNELDGTVKKGTWTKSEDERLESFLRDAGARPSMEGGTMHALPIAVGERCTQFLYDVACLLRTSSADVWPENCPRPDAHHIDAVVDASSAYEQAILAARDVLDVAILRPAAIYGRGSWVWGTWWGPLLAAARSGSQDGIQIPADKAARTGAVHVDDLAAAYLGALDRIHGQLGSWPVFDISTENLSVVDLLEAAKAALGVKAELVYGGTYGSAFLEALSLVANTDSSRAKQALGWVPKKVDFVPNTAVYVNAWRATEELKPKA